MAEPALLGAVRARHDLAEPPLLRALRAALSTLVEGGVPPLGTGNGKKNPDQQILDTLLADLGWVGLASIWNVPPPYHLA